MRSLFDTSVKSAICAHYPQARRSAPLAHVCTTDGSRLSFAPSGRLRPSRGWCQANITEQSSSALTPARRECRGQADRDGRDRRYRAQVQPCRCCRFGRRRETVHGEEAVLVPFCRPDIIHGASLFANARIAASRTRLVAMRRRSVLVVAVGQGPKPGRPPTGAAVAFVTRPTTAPLLRTSLSSRRRHDWWI
jgi:hypothetical protein